MTFCLRGVSVVPGEIGMSVAELAGLHAATETAIRKSLGDMRVCRTERHACDLAADAARAAVAERGISPVEIDFIFYCSCGQQDEHRVAKLGAEIGSPKTPVIRLVGGCDVMLQAIELARSCLRSTDGRRALLVYADKKISPQRTLGPISETTPRNLMSDGAAAMFVEAGSGLSMLGCGVAYDAKFADLYSGGATQPRSREEELAAVVLTINCARTAVAQCLAEAKVAQADVRWFIHPLEAAQVAGLILRKLGAPLELRLTNPAGVSHPLGADPFFELHDALAGGRVATGDTVEIIARGISSVHCLLLRRDA